MSVLSQFILGMSDDRFNVVMNAVVALAVLVWPAILIRIQRQTARRVEEVKADLINSKVVSGHDIAEIKQSNVEIHRLVNGARGELLKELATALQKIAHVQPTKANVEAAAVAEKTSDAHNAVQDSL